MKKLINPICFLFMLMFLFNSCDKEETRMELITKSPWNVKLIEFKLPSESTWTASPNSCNYDDIWEFTSSELIIYSGSNLCQGQNNTINDPMGFRLGAGDTKIIFTLYGYDYEEDIVELTDNVLITTYAVGDVDKTQGRRTFER